MDSRNISTLLRVYLYAPGSHFAFSFVHIAVCGVSRILGNGNGSGKRERELPFAILLTIKPFVLKSLSHCHVQDFKWQCIQC